MNNKTKNGYALVEVVISITVAIMVIGALTFATISSLRNAQLAKRQAQATKYAQEGLEKVRSIRDRNGAVQGVGGGVNVFSDLWGVNISSSLCSANPGTVCYFKLVNGVLTRAANATDTESLSNGTFQRQIQMVDKSDCSSTSASCYQLEKQIISIVIWTDFAGDHQSKLTSILRKL